LRPALFSSRDGAYPFSGVTRGLDPRVHPLRKSVFAKKMDCRVKPGNDEGEIVPTILCPDSEVRIIVPHSWRNCMIRLTSAAAAALLCWLASAVAQTAPTTAGPVPSAVIEELVLANRILNDRGVLDAYGHVSIRHPSDPGRYLMARAIAPGLVTAEDIMEFDLESNPVDRRGRSLFVERFIHGEAYKSRPDVNSVIHTHSAGVIPFSVTPTPLRPVIHNASFLHVGVPVWDIRDAGGATNMLVRDGKLGQSLAAALGDKPVALMRGHGNVVVGPNVRVATARAIFTDENARMQAVALSLGGPVNYLSSAEGALRDREPSDPARAWDLWKANVMKKPQ
jgi:ribulose-5-phosphate 4-epimerase/fuculose-1-phosphate aldolase